MLDRFIEAVSKDGNNLGIRKKNSHFTADSLACDLTRLALAAFNTNEVRSLTASSPKKDSVKGRQLKTGVEKLYLEHARGTARSATARALAEIVENAPDGCPLSAPPSEAEVRNIVEHYLDYEENIGIHGRLDTLGRAAIANVIQTKLRERRLFPVRTHDQALAFWKQASNSSLNVGAVSGSTDEGATFTEITSRFLHPIRISINAVLAASKDTAKANTMAGKTDSTSLSAVTRFLNGGGLFNVAAAFPWLHLGTSNGALDFVGLLAPRVGGTLPVLGASARDTTLLYDVGTELFFKSTDDRKDGLGFFAQSRIGVAGGSSRFMTLIGDPGKKRTAYQTVSIGMTLDDKYLITLSRTVAGPHSLQTGWQIGTTIARSAAAPSATP